MDILVRCSIRSDRTLGTGIRTNKCYLFFLGNYLSLLTHSVCCYRNFIEHVGILMTKLTVVAQLRPLRHSGQKHERARLHTVWCDDRITELGFSLAETFKLHSRNNVLLRKLDAMQCIHCDGMSCIHSMCHFGFQNPSWTALIRMVFVCVCSHYGNSY